VPKLDRALRSAAVVAKQSTEPLATLDPTAESRFLDRRFDEPVAYPLVIPLGVVVHHVLTNRPPKVRFPDRDHLRQALRLDRSDESLGVRVQIGASAGEPDWMDAGALERCPKRLCEERITVVNEITGSEKESVFTAVQFRAT
jgi:hypothetical protein